MKLQFGHTVRWRLTLWYTLVLFLTFAVFSAVVVRFVAHDLNDLIDSELLDTGGAFDVVLKRACQGGKSPTEAHLQEEFDEMGLSTQIALRLDLPGRETIYFNARSLPVSLLNEVLRSGGAPGRPLTIFAKGHSWRVLRTEGNSDAAYQLLLARNLSPIEAQLNTLRSTLLIALPLILLFATASGYLLAAQALKPIAQITQKARHIEANALQERLEMVNPGDEIGQLAEVLNDLFARLQKAFQQQRQLLADAAHELRTPAAILRSQSDVVLEQPRSAAEYETALAAIRTETEHLSSIVDDLLFIARAEADQLPVMMEPVDLVEIVDESCRVLRPLIKNRNLILNWQVGDEISVCGDARLLRRAAMNLLTNAIKYTSAGGLISVRVDQASDHSAIAIADTGKGVAVEDLPHIFDRFYRGNRLSSYEADGSGLGLAIVKTIADMHGGRITVRSEPGKGSTFTLCIPKAMGPQPAGKEIT